MSQPAGTYTYRQLADRIEAVLGRRPSVSTLRAATATTRRTTTSQSRPRLTLGMPPPEPAPTRTAPARFDAAKVEAWLATHPLRRWLAADADYRAALRDPTRPIDATIALARRRGLTWTQITTGLHDECGDRRSRAGIYKAYRHATEQRDSLPPRGIQPGQGGLDTTNRPNPRRPR